MNTPSAPQHAAFRFGHDRLTLDALAKLADGSLRAELASEAATRMRASAAVVEALHEKNTRLYGVTTSFGASVDTTVPPELSAALSLNLMRFHGCGTGRLLTQRESAAVLVARLQSVAAAKSGVRTPIGEQLAWMLNERILPAIPAEGSVGASGDLTPLSYVVACLAGQRQVLDGSTTRPTAEALREHQRPPVEIGPKEALALMNGTSVCGAMAGLAWHDALRLARVACRLTAMTSYAVRGNPSHFDGFVHDARPHPGQQLAARWIREDLQYDANEDLSDRRLQDRYSIRCAPQIIGVLLDTLQWTRTWLETELNGVSDNPVIDTEGQRAVHGGNFYGGHVAAVADALKPAVANVAALMDRQLMVLCNKRESDGLPANLVGVTGEEACIHNGFKAVTIATSALAAEALKLTTPASVFSRSTELHNQDQVPMAPLAVRDLLRINELGETIAAMHTLACCQAVELRGIVNAPDDIQTLVQRVREEVPALEGDRPMDREILHLQAHVNADALPFGEAALPRH